MVFPQTGHSKCPGRKNNSIHQALNLCYIHPDPQNQPPDAGGVNCIRGLAEHTVLGMCVEAQGRWERDLWNPPIMVLAHITKESKFLHSPLHFTDEETEAQKKERLICGVFSI